MLSLLASVAWVPRTAAGLRSYWRGNWKLAKEMSYERGGLSGTFTGARSNAVYTVRSHHISITLHQHMGSHCITWHRTSTQAGRSSRPSTTAGSRMQRQVSRSWARTHSRRAGGCFTSTGAQGQCGEARIQAARFFHDISLDGSEPCLSKHPCGPDVYSGRLIFESVDAFRFDWRVTGPRKQGWITNRFRREPGPDE